MFLFLIERRIRTQYIMNILVLLCLVGIAFGQIQLPHGHDLKVLIDNAFRRVDHAPADGTVTEAEFDSRADRDDANHDSCVTFAEYQAAHSTMPAEIAQPLYTHTAGNDNCLNIDDYKQEFHVIDKDNDGQATMKEFEHYYTHVATQLFGHGHHG